MLSGLLCLLVLTATTGMLVSHAEAGRFLFPLRAERSDDAQLDALVTAIDVRDLAAVRRLLRGGRVDVNGVDRNGVTPIYYALTPPEAPAAVLVGILIDAGADVNGRGARHGPPLQLLVGRGCPALVEQLLRGGADPNGRNARKWTALHCAAMCDDVDAARALLQAGARADVKDDEGFTPLDVALAHGAQATAALLARPHS